VCAEGIATFVLMPTVTPFRGDPGFDPLGMLLAVQRATDSPATALPSFHVFWIVLAGRFLAIDRRRTSRVMLLIIGLLQIAACHLTGMHSLIDIAGGVALAARPLARCGLRLAQTVVDSAGCVHVGPLRIFFHGLAVLAAASTGYVVALAFLPLGKSPLPLYIVALAALADAGLWGQFVEGGRTSRPFGFFGGLLAAVACVAVLVLRGDMGLQYAAAATIALPFTQAVGRLRCLMHGCCHGRLCAATEAGLRYTHPLSRVAGIAALTGRPIMATQIFSLVTNVVIGLVLVRLAIFDNDIAHILAAYLVLMGLV
jgi:Prolipoprotein diacylglyceryl transferase/PAP2 superfamily